ncbi:hypothetical protein MGN70_014322 [Eutypa lata]|nr:hypothetical protein MGN70_014322 [Eutypa lata]
MTSTSGTTQNLHPDKVSPEHVKTLGITAMMSLLAIVSVVLRFVSRKITAKYWWDDWTAAGALAFAVGFLITTTLSATIGGAGYHINTYSKEQLTLYLKAWNCQCEIVLDALSSKLRIRTFG